VPSGIKRCVARRGAGIYCASKFAVRGLTEALRGVLARYNIGVSCLYTTNVNTNIAEATFTRRSWPRCAPIYSAGMDPVELAEHVVMAIRKNQLYVIPYPEARASVQASFDAVLAGLPPEDSEAEGVSKRKAAMARFVQERQEREKQA
jgi:short-subunit dehydrogenase